MDISASAYNLHNEEEKEAIAKQKQQDAHFKEILASCTSLSKYESRRFLTLVPQIIATLIVASFHVVVGISLAYSAILIPQLRETDIVSGGVNLTENATNLDLEQKEAWIASTAVLVVPIAAIMCGVLMDWLGRLNTIKLTVIPVVIGWICIASAQNFGMILAGRVLSGIAGAFGTNPAIVYIAEIARPDMRGSFVSSGPGFASLGMVIAYFMGWFMNWRTIAWISIFFSIFPFILICFIPESPAWYVSKGRIDEARKSLEWLHKYQPQPAGKTKTMAHLHLDVLLKEQEKKQKEREANKHTGISQILREFIKPTATKPLAILLLFFFFQQFSGIYITLFNSIDFFQQIGSTMNPYMTSIFVGAVRFGMSMANTYLQKQFPRRGLVMTSCAGMAACMIVSGFFTKWILAGTSTMTWVPVICVLLYVITSMIGLLPIPWTMTPELFPLEIRGTAQSLAISCGNLIMFLALQTYPSLTKLLGGVVQAQWFFAAICLIGIVYTYIFLPETHEKKLSEIVEYFKHNTLYITSKRKKKNKAELIEVSDRKPIVINSRLTKEDFDNSPNGQSKNLIEEA